MDITNLSTTQSRDGLLAAPLVAQLEQLKSADLVIGIPSYNNAKTIAHVVCEVERGLIRYFPHCRALILNSDGGSTDDTPGVFLKTAGTRESTVLKLSTRYQGMPGKGSAVRTIFAVMQSLGAQAGVMVDSDLRSITSEWIRSLLGPILDEGKDYVTPYYRRHKNDGTITNMAVYPLTHALYGQRVRQPIGGDFGFSGKLAKRYLEDSVWETDVARFGIDVWMTTLALAEGYQVCQTRLGAKIHDAKDPGESLGPMFKQVLSTLFSLVERYERVWQSNSGGGNAPIYGTESDTAPPPVQASVPGMVEKFKAGLQQYRDVLSVALAKAQWLELDALSQQADPHQFEFPADLWIKTLYDVAAASRQQQAERRQQLVEALAPVYMGRTAAFVNATRAISDEAAEELVEQQCQRFIELKPYLVERWE